eukprot:gene2082-2274_t
MSLSIVLNSNNVATNGTKSQYNYNFINGGLNIPENSLMCVSNVTIPYSWFNVNSNQYNNNSFQYTFPTPNPHTGATVFTVTLPNGFYSATDINNYLQTQMIANKQYLVNSAGEYVYFLTLQYDTNYYAVQLECFAVPDQLPLDYTNPANMTFPAAGAPATPTVTIFSYNNFGTLIGFNAGTYPTTSQTTNQSFTSNTVPDGSPVNALIMRCNLIDNNVVMPSDIMDSIPISAVFGSNITYQPPFPKWVKMKAGKYSSMTVQLVDQDLNPIIANDSNVLITLLLMLGTSTAAPYTKR